MKSILHICAQKEFFVPLILGVLFSLTSNFAGWDLALQDYFWNKESESWIGPSIPAFRWLYYFGVIPALVVGVGALFTMALSFSLKRLNSYRKIAAFLIFILIFGNGIITNGILKEFWGRPRPSDLALYNGSRNFEPSLTIDTSSKGKSFPCGHATMGFYFFGVTLLLPKRKQRLLVGAGTALFGASIGLARMSYGGHFLTDVIWAAVVMWLTSFLLYRALGLHRSLLYHERPPANRKERFLRKAGRLIIFPSFLLLVIGIGFGTPRDKTKNLAIQLQDQPSQRLTLNLEGLLKIETDQNPQTLIFSSRGTGFGYPKSVLQIRKRQNSLCGCTEVFHQKQGIFTELHATTRLLLPRGYIYELQLQDSDLEALYIDRQRIDPPPVVKIDLR